MGGRLVIRRYDDCRNSEVISKIKADQDQAAHEDGHSYSGDWGDKHGVCVYENKIFDTPDEAQDFIGENSDKSDPIVAVKARVMLTSTYAKHLKCLGELNALKKTIGLTWDRDLRIMIPADGNTLVTSHLVRLKSGKSKSRACPKCGKRIIIANMVSADCPHCREMNIFFNQSEINKHEKVKAKREALSRQADSLLRQHFDEKRAGLKVRNVKGLIWLAGGWCRE